MGSLRFLIFVIDNIVRQGDASDKLAVLWTDAN